MSTHDKYGNITSLDELLNAPEPETPEDMAYLDTVWSEWEQNVLPTYHWSPEQEYNNEGN